MRIRKRPATLTSSESISPLNLSDPHHFNRLPVMVQLVDSQTPPKPCSTSLLEAPSSLDRYQPSDQTLPLIGKPINGYDSPSIIDQSGVHKQLNTHHPLLNLQEEKIRGKEKEIEESNSRENKNNHISKGDTFVLSDQLLPLPQSFVQDGRWCEGEEAIPLKKRKGRLESIGIMDGKKVKAKMKTKMNKKCSSMGKLDDEEEVDEESEMKGNSNTKKRVTKRGSALMEGSRCSRVNGRGWRCCQQTLVGYSLCEHHLGKGRLRSMTSVRNRSSIGFSSSTITAPSNNNVVVVDSTSSSNSDVEKRMIVDNMDDEDEKKMVVITKKKMKLGMVKARSISSLLGQTDNKVATIVDEKNNK